jgi:hypothetical protein
MRQVYKNNRNFIQQVPSPNGGGINVPPGKSVEGDFFKILAQYKILDPVLDSDVDDASIVFRYGVSAPVIQEKPQEIRREAPDVSPGVQEQSFKSNEEISNEISNYFNGNVPFKKDLSKMSLEELRGYAQKIGLDVSGNETKRELTKLIILKEG